MFIYKLSKKTIIERITEFPLTNNLPKKLINSLLVYYNYIISILIIYLQNFKNIRNK